jgi:hypothetical protein
VSSAIQEDPVKPYTFDEFQNARVAMLLFAQNRSRFVNEGLRTAGFASASRSASRPGLRRSP